MESKGIPCKKLGEQFCHGSIVKQYGQNYANVCNNGDVSLMRIYPGYSGPAPCSHQGKKYCSGNKVAGGGSVFVEQVCDDGTVFFINKITGLKFQRGRLSENSGKAEKKPISKKTKKFNKNSIKINEVKQVVSSTSPPTSKTLTTIKTTRAPRTTRATPAHRPTPKTTTTTTTTTTNTPTFKTTITQTTQTETLPTQTTNTQITSAQTTVPQTTNTEAPFSTTTIPEITEPNQTTLTPLAHAISKLLKKIKSESNLKEDARSISLEDDTNDIDETDKLAEEMERAGSGRSLSMVSMDYVNTILDEDAPNARVLQCWTEQSICFIQTDPDELMPELVQDHF